MHSENAMSAAVAAQLQGARLQGAGNAARPIRHLERLSAEADRVAHAAAMISAFLGRFHGNGPEADTEAAGQVGYRNDLDRLSANVNQLSALVESLVDLG